jgi:hypothetical protein
MPRNCELCMVHIYVIVVHNVVNKFYFIFYVELS